MAVSIGSMLLIKGYEIPEITFRSIHPESLHFCGLCFITITCGAVSGFHSTQSPIMARCLINEKYGRRIFYGAMIAKETIALIRAAAMSFCPEGVGGLNKTITGRCCPGGKECIIGFAGTCRRNSRYPGSYCLIHHIRRYSIQECTSTIADAMSLDQRPLKVPPPLVACLPPF